MKKFTLFLILISFAVLTGNLRANNVQVANTSLTNQSLAGAYAQHYTYCQFDLTWDNSWRTSAGPKNWDAVWIFVKYQVFGQAWQHATLSTVSNEHSVGNNSGVNATFQPGSDGKGVMIYRANAVGSTGSIAWFQTRVKWNYPADGVADAAQVTIKVFAIEMVDIPQGPFFIGDGTVGNNSFRDGLGYPFKITGEGSIVFQNTSGGSTSQPADPLISGGYTVPSGFPKGYQEFYVMKYEITQQQYQEFFNTLPNNKVLKDNKNITSSYRNSLSWSGLANDGMTGGERAQNNLSYSEICAYADWAAMRPMTELEFEKCSRGCDNSGTPTAVFPVQNEFAWGNTNAYNPNTVHGNQFWGYAWANSCGYGSTTSTSNCYGNTLLTNDNSSTEKLVGSCSTGYNICTIGCGYCCSYNFSLFNINAQATTTTTSLSGPVRVGIFAAKSCSSLQRERAGASYYGVMELSGNVAEIVIRTFEVQCIGTVSFNNTNGDGVLSAQGFANVDRWYQYTCNGSGQDITVGMSYLPICVRGGSWNDSFSYANTSDRNQVQNSSGAYGSSRDTRLGGRLVRIP